MLSGTLYIFSQNIASFPHPCLIGIAYWSPKEEMRMYMVRGGGRRGQGLNAEREARAWKWSRSGRGDTAVSHFGWGGGGPVAKEEGWQDRGPTRQER